MRIQVLLGHFLVLRERSARGGRQPGREMYNTTGVGYWPFKRDAVRVGETSRLTSMGLGRGMGLRKTRLGRRGGEWHSRPQHSWSHWIPEPPPLPVWLNIWPMKHTRGHSTEECWAQPSMRQEKVCK